MPLSTPATVPNLKDVHSPWKSSKPQDCPAKPRPDLDPGCRAGPAFPSEPTGPLHKGQLMSRPSWGAPFLPDRPMFTRQKQTVVYGSTCLGNARIPASLPPLSGQETATFSPMKNMLRILNSQNCLHESIEGDGKAPGAPLAPQAIPSSLKFNPDGHLARPLSAHCHPRPQGGLVLTAPKPQDSVGFELRHRAQALLQASCTDPITACFNRWET